MKTILALDAGTGSVRAILFNENGDQIYCAQREWFHNVDERFSGSMNFDWVTGWNLICECIQEVVKKVA